MNIYLAGPLFTAGERLFNVQLARSLREAGHRVFLPQENQSADRTAMQIFEDNIAAIGRADAIVANMDGSDPDSGTCWECGYAYGKKTVVVFRTDFRAAEDSRLAPYNVMLWASATNRLDLPSGSVEEVASGLTRVLAQYGSAFERQS